MPLKKLKTATKHKKSTSAARARALTHQSFFAVVILTLILWGLYRSIFSFPVWFDEIIGKAIFFFVPVWVYVNITGFRPIIDSLRLKKLKPGLLAGLAIGGLYGFITLFLRVVMRGGAFQVAPVFLATAFWREMFLSLMTAFWETIFFYSFVMTVIQDRFISWPLVKQLVLTVTIFMLFHIPNIFLRFTGVQVLSMLFLLALFSLGQGLLYAKKQNAYQLILSHAIWGMALLVFF